MLHIDFWFEDSGGQLVIIGWSDLPGVPLLLGENPSFDPVPVFVDRYSRVDLGSSAPLAFVAIFAMRDKGQPEPLDAASLEVNGQSGLLTDMGKGFRALAEAGVKEAYDRVFLLLSAGHIALAIDQACASVVKRRMANYPIGTLETIQFAVSVDAGLVTRDGAALLEGWFLVHRKYPSCKLHGFRISDDTISGLRVFSGEVDRADLEGFAGRYDFTGRDGFVATTSQSATHDCVGNSLLFLAIDTGATTAIVQAPVQLAAGASIARMLALTQQTLKRIDHRRDVMEGFLANSRRNDLDGWAEGFSDRAEGKLAVVVDLDVNGEFSSDLCLAFYDRHMTADRVVLIVDQNERAAFRAIDRIIAEMAGLPDAIQISIIDRGDLGAALTTLEHDGFARILFGRASVLFHLLDADLDLLARTCSSGSAELLVFSSRAAASGIVQAEGTGGYQPLVMAAPLKAVRRALASVPEVFMTEEAMLKYVVARWPECFARHLAREHGLLLGRLGQHNAIMVWGRNSYSVDSMALSVMLKVGSLA